MAGKRMWLILIIFLVAVSLIASSCAKKQMVKEEMGTTPAVEAKKAEPQPEVSKEVQKSKEEAANPATMGPVAEPKESVRKPLGEANIEAKPQAIDLAALRIQFAFDDFSLSSKSRENLAKIAAWLQNNPGTKIQIQGNTCDLGTDEYNLALGEKRAESAEKYLVGLGVNSDRLSRISYGEEKPMVPNTDETNRSLNRRDEFVMLK